MTTRPYIVAIVLAAGRSSRLGDRNKLLQKIDGTPLIQRVVQTALGSRCQEVLVITGHEHDSVESAVSDTSATCVFNPDFADGMSSSIKAGIKALPSHCDGFFVILGDMPDLTVDIIDNILDQFKDNICVPEYDNRQGNPILFARRFCTDILSLSGDVGAKAIVKRYRKDVRAVPIASDAIHLDLDDDDAFDRYTQRTLSPSGTSH